MRLIVAGGRDYKLTDLDKEQLKNLILSHEVTEVVTGGCRGVDQDAETLAIDLGLLTTTFRPAWDKYGRAAGPLRNEEMAKYADMCVLFPGGAGTQSMKSLAEAYELLVVDWMKPPKEIQSA